MNTHLGRWNQLWIGARLATMRGAELGLIENGAVATCGSQIAWVGSREELESLEWEADDVVDAHGALITPGLIDCHTHLVYAGDRSQEFAARLSGQTYAQIARAGGGILSTMRATRAASAEQLFAESAPRAKALMREGVTTIEIKSGYGLTLEHELKMLQVAQRIGTELGITVHRTFLGAHALPPEYGDRSQDYVRAVCEEMLPAVASSNAAEAVDVFCESIAFTPEQTREIFTKARQLGLALHIHADQLSDSSGAVLAAQFGALSADHLEYASAEGLARMKAADVTAVLLPAAYYYLREQTVPPIEALRELGISIAIATDCNPGTAPIASLLLAANFGCILFRLTPVEVLRGITVNAARALGMHDRGMLEAGKRADFAVWRIRDPERLCAEVGMHVPLEIVIGGRRGSSASR